MKNLEQIRAAHALSAARQLDRGAVTKLPALIINNGLLATIAFTLDSSTRKAMLDALLKIADYLVPGWKL
jgi:CRISPR-associated protein Cmr5